MCHFSTSKEQKCTCISTQTLCIQCSENLSLKDRPLQIQKKGHNNHNARSVCSREPWSPLTAYQKFIYAKISNQIHIFLVLFCNAQSQRSVRHTLGYTFILVRGCYAPMTCNVLNELSAYAKNVPESSAKPWNSESRHTRASFSNE